MNTPKMLLAAAPTIGLAADVVMHLIATWLLPIRGLYPRLLFGAACGGAASVALAAYAAQQLALPPADAAGAVLFDAFTFAVLSFGYFNFVQMNLSSLRLRIANELHASPDGIEPERLYEKYDAREIVDERLARLSRGRQILCRDGRYYHRWSTVYLIALCMDAAKRIVFRRRIRDSFHRRTP